MSDMSIGELLRSIQFFHDIADAHLERLAEIARPVEYPRAQRYISGAR